MGYYVVGFIVGLILLALWIYSNRKPKEEIQIIEIKYFGEALVWLNLVNDYRLSIGLHQLTPIKKLDERAQIVLATIPPVEHYYNGDGYEIVGGEHNTLTALFRHYLTAGKGHKKIIERQDINYIGIGIKKTNNDYYNTTLFI